MLPSTVTVILYITASYNNLLCSIVLQIIFNTVTIITLEVIPVKNSLFKLTEVVPLKISSLKVSTEQDRELHKLLTSQLEGEVVTGEKNRPRPSAQTCDLHSNAKFQPCEALILVTILHLQLS